MINLIVKKIITKYLKIEHYNYLVKLYTVEYKEKEYKFMLDSFGYEAEFSLFIKGKLYASLSLSIHNHLLLCFGFFLFFLCEYIWNVLCDIKHWLIKK